MCWLAGWFSSSSVSILSQYWQITWLPPSDTMERMDGCSQSLSQSLMNDWKKVFLFPFPIRETALHVGHNTTLLWAGPLPSQSTIWCNAMYMCFNTSFNGLAKLKESFICAQLHANYVSKQVKSESRLTDISERWVDTYPIYLSFAHPRSKKWMNTEWDSLALHHLWNQFSSLLLCS